MTGATGVMGMAGLKELIRFQNEYDITVLARTSRKNKKKLSPFIKRGVKVIWGDLLNLDSVRKGVENADIVLHVGGLVSPMADKFPQKTIQVNIESTRLLCETIKLIENQNPEREIKFVYIGSVSQYGSHLPPNHWSYVGKKLSAAIFDAYAYSKIMAERVMLTSGIKSWVSLRQTSILHPGLLKKTNDPIMFHVPLRGVLEWVSQEDSGKILERVCRKTVPKEFWCNIYNIGGGSSYRLTNHEFEQKILKAICSSSPEKIFQPNWFATQNFHGVWFADSDQLNEMLHFRNGMTFDEALNAMKERLPFYFKLTPIVPSCLIKGFMKKIAKSKPLGPLSWINSQDNARINAFWGSKQNYNEIGGWENQIFPHLNPSKPPMIESNCSNKNISRELVTKTCVRGHKYITSDYMEIIAGHGCPECLKEETMINY